MRFSRIYGLYVNNDFQKNTFFGFGYRKPWVRIPSEAVGSSLTKGKRWEYSPPVKIPPLRPKKTVYDGLFFILSKQTRTRTHLAYFALFSLALLLIFVRTTLGCELGSHSPRRARSETAREYKKTTECCFPSSVTESQREQARL